MIEHYASNITTNLINILVPKTFRTLTILCIIDMVFCFVLGFMGYGGGLLINHNIPNKYPDEEAVETETSGSEHLQELEPRPVDEFGSDDLHPGYDGTIPEEPDVDGTTRTTRSKKPMQVISPEPMSDNEDIPTPKPSEVDQQARGYQRIQEQIKHISEHIVEHVAQQEAMTKTCGRGVVTCPACDLEHLSRRLNTISKREGRRR